MLRCLQRLFIRAAIAVLVAALSVSMTIPLMLGLTTVAHAAVTMPATPNTANLVLICRFSGDNNDTVSANWKSMMREFNATTDATGTTGISFKNYVGTASKGKLNVESVFPQNSADGNDSLTYLDLDMTPEQYASAENDLALLTSISEAFNKTYATYDISKANLDDDSTRLDNVMIFMQLPSGKTIASHAGNMAHANLKLKGVTIDDYEVMGYSRLESMDGVPAHEYLHTFGSLDLYRANGQGDFVTGWDMMGQASPSALPLAITAQDMGWDTIDFVNTSGEYTLGTYVSGKAHAVAFKSPLNDDEYFVAEYRKGNLEGVNQYQADKRLGGKTASDLSGATDGLIVYRVNKNYGPTGDGSGNKQEGHDYVYVFRPGDSAATHPGGDAAGNIKGANIAVGQTFGNANQTAGIADSVICYSDGTNSQITVEVLSNNDSGLKFKLTIPTYADRSLWAATPGAGGASSFYRKQGTKLSAAVIGDTVYGLASGDKTAVIIEKSGDSWKQIGDYSDMSNATLAALDGKVVVAGASDTDAVVRMYDGSGWSETKITGVSTPRVTTHDGKLYATVLTNSMKAADIYRFDNGAWQKVGASISGTYFTDAVMLDGTHCAVADFMGTDKSARVYTLQGETWTETDKIQMTPRSVSSVAIGGKTYVYVSDGGAGSVGKLYTLGADGKLAAVHANNMPQINDLKLSSDGTNLIVTYTTMTGNPNKTYVFTADTTASQLEFKQLGDPVASPASDSSETVVTGGKAYTLVSNSGTVQLRSHSFGVAVHKIVYELDGGVNSADSPITYTEGTSVVLKDASKPGYRFDGWYKEANFVTKVERITAGQTGGMTLYAKFTANTYDITYVLAGGTNDAANPKTYTYGVGVASFKPAVKSGYTFDGWYTDAGFTSAIESIDTAAMGSMTLYAKWTAHKDTTVNPTPDVHPTPTPDDGDTGNSGSGSDDSNDLLGNGSLSEGSEHTNSTDKYIVNKPKWLSATGSAVLMIAVPVLLTLAAGLVLLALYRGKE